MGTSAGRVEGPEKLCGLTKYIDDMTLPGCLHGTTFRSSIAHGRIKKINFDPAFPWKECVIASASDIPGHNAVALIEYDQPFLADKIIRHPMEPILVVAHADRQKAFEAIRHISVEYEELPAVLSIQDSLAGKQIWYGKNNVFKDYLIEKGNLEEGFSKADIVVSGEYFTPHQEQAYIENNGVISYIEEDGTVVVMGSLQCPYYVHKALKHLFNLPDAKVRVIQIATGGGFGGKEEYPSILAGHAALLALKSKRPVKIIYDRPEDMAATTKRHPALTRHKTGVTKDGRLVAQDIEVVMDGGAYLTLSPVVLSRGTLHAAGAYECPNVRVRSSVVATNTPPNGAFRGFGAPQTVFAVELHMARVAEALGMDPVELRRKNIFKVGSVTATGQVLRESVGASESLERVVRKSRYFQKKKEYDRLNKGVGSVWKGIGLAVCHHGAGFTGSGEVMLASRAAVALTRRGEIVALAASTEIGQGTSTMFMQIVAEALDVPVDWVRTETPDTAKVPNSGPTVASRTCMVVGGLLRRAAVELKDAVQKAGGSLKSRGALKKAALKLCGKKSEVRFETEFQKPGEVQWDDKTYKGDAYGVYSYAAVAVDLEIDKATYEVRVNKVTTAQDIGKAINPLFVEGQIIGGTAQGLGYALHENVVYRNGSMLNSQFTNYIIPTALDTPEMHVDIVEQPYSRGPFGAKGVGELPMGPPAPAVAAAVHQAIGRWITEIPILPEKIQQAIQNETKNKR